MAFSVSYHQTPPSSGLPSAASASASSSRVASRPLELNRRLNTDFQAVTESMKGRAKVVFLKEFNKSLGENGENSFDNYFKLLPQQLEGNQKLIRGIFEVLSSLAGYLEMLHTASNIVHGSIFPRMICIQEGNVPLLGVAKTTCYVQEDLEEDAKFGFFMQDQKRLIDVGVKHFLRYCNAVCEDFEDETYNQCHALCGQLIDLQAEIEQSGRPLENLSERLMEIFRSVQPYISGL